MAADGGRRGETKREKLSKERRRIMEIICRSGFHGRGE